VAALVRFQPIHFAAEGAKEAGLLIAKARAVLARWSAMIPKAAGPSVPEPVQKEEKQASTPPVGVPQSTPHGKE